MHSTNYLSISLLVLFLGVACSQSTVANVGGNSESAGGAGPGGAGGGQIANTAILTVLDAGHFSGPPTGIDARPWHCDDQGNCSCLTIASLGQVAQYGSDTGDNTTAFQDYMNTQTKGTVKMAMFGNAVGSPKSFALTSDFLKNYNVIILQALEQSVYTTQVWNFTADETKALSDWVNNGGGLIAMTGYGGNSIEVQPLNQLLSQFGITYNTDDIFIESDCPDTLCYCTNTSMPFGGWNPSDTLLVSNLDSANHRVGVFRGRSINCSDCQIMATWKNLNVGVHKQVGAGRVFAWADEWVTYTSQWTGDPRFINKDQCAPRTADKIYAIPQFWYNVFRWVAGDDSGCFQMADTDVVQR